MVLRAASRAALTEARLKAFVYFMHLTTYSQYHCALRRPLLLASPLPWLTFAFHLPKRGERNILKNPGKWDYKTTNTVKREIRGQAENF